jgi:hypothetical protein
VQKRHFSERLAIAFGILVHRFRGGAFATSSLAKSNTFFSGAKASIVLFCLRIEKMIWITILVGCHNLKRRFYSQVRLVRAFLCGPKNAAYLQVVLTLCNDLIVAGGVPFCTLFI